MLRDGLSGVVAYFERNVKMTKKEFTEQANKAAGLQYDLWRKFPSYVHLDLTLSADKDGDKIKFNIYTPELNHNNYSNIQDFVRFMECVIKDGVKNVRIRILEERLRNAKTNKEDAIDTICDTQKELDKLK